MNKVKTKSGARVMPAYVTNGAAVGVTMARKAQSWGHIDEVELCQRLRRSTGFQMAPCGLLAVFDEIAEVLREGYDVHLSERCRFFTCVNKSRTQLEVVAQTMGKFRKAMADIPFAFDCGGETVSAEKLNERARRSRSRRPATAEGPAKQVTPDVQVTCPNCGTTFRVGRRVAA